MPTHRTLYLLRSGAPSVEAHVLAGLLSGSPAGTAAVCVLDSPSPAPIAAAQMALLPAAVVRPHGAPRALVRAVADLARGVGATLVHSVGADAHLVGGRAARRAGLPALWSQLGIAAWRDLRHLRAALAPARASLAYTERGLAAQRRLPGGRRARGLPLGVPISTEQRGIRSRRARSTLGVPGDAFIAALAGPVTRPDGTLLAFLEAGRSLCHARPRAHLLLPSAARGAGRDVAAMIQNSVASLRDAGRIHELSAADDDLAVYDAADVVAWDAAPDVLPIGVLFSMAAGAAVVAADRPLVREFAEDRADAVFVPPGDSEALAVALLALADDPDQRETLALAADARVRERADARVMAARAAAIEAELRG